MSRRARIAAAATAVLREQGLPAVVYGDVWLLDDIGARAELPRMHPLNRHKMILDALERSPREFVKRYGRWSTNNHRCRGFWRADVPPPESPDVSTPHAAGGA